ncbi:MAG: beta-galactosidase [Candidatus Omnitrophica bacterium]|nr:beta-galactosidase [Candidatus Omnitrophota bacterium]
MKRLFLFFLFATGFLRADVSSFQTQYFTPKTDLETPHIKWLSPYKGGRINVLWITYRRDGGFREIVELNQRMDINFTLFTLATPDKFNPWSGYYKPVAVTDQEYQKDLEEKLSRQYDIIVLGKIRWKALPQSAREMILNKVLDGTILLAYLGDWGGCKIAEDIKSEDLTEVVGNKINLERKFLYPFKGLPQFKNYKDFENFINSTLEVYSYGKGKALFLKGYSVPHFQNLTPANMRSPAEIKIVEYDYLLAYIIQLMISYIKKPEVEISGTDYIATNINSFPGIKFLLKSDKAKKVSYECILRNEDNEVILKNKKDLNLAKGENEIWFEIKEKLPKGNYFADIFVKENNDILNFGSCFIELTSDDYISDIVIDKSFKKEQDIAGEVRVFSKEGRDNLKLKISLIDNFGRLQKSQILECKGQGVNEKKVSFKIDPPQNYFTLLQFLKFELLDDNSVVDRSSKLFSVSNLRHKNDDFRAILWFPYYNAAYTEKWYCKNIFDSGFDSRYYTGIALAPLAENLWYVSNPIRFVDMKTDPWGTMDRKPEDHIRQPCLNDPEYLAKVEKELTDKLRSETHFSTYEFSCGDECHFASWRPPYDRYELCWCDRCVEKFHQYLQNKYGTLKNLNQNWNTDYKSFDEIKPVTFKEAIENQNLRPLWINYRIFMEDSWTGIFEYAKKIITNIVPDAKVGYEGSQRGYTFTNSFTAEDYYKLAQVMSLNNPYSHAFIRYAFKDFSKDDTLIGLGWQGSYGSGIKNRKIDPWRVLFYGANSLWIWHGPPREQSVVSPDLSFYEYFRPYVEQIPELKSGIGKLFMNSKREDDGIAILYSNTSVHASALTPQLPPICENLNFFVRYFESSGYQFRLISYKQLEDGILKQGNFRLLVLPFVQSISQKQAKEIASFVNNGGTVIADIRPGICDENGIFYKNRGILDDIFGVIQTTEKFEVKKYENLELKYSDLTCNLPSLFVDASVSLQKGQAKEVVENVPVFIVNKSGKGKGVLLNLGFINYPDENMAGIKNILNSVIEQAAGIKKKIEFEPDNLEAGFTTYRYASGSHTYIGILSPWREGGEKDSKLTFSQKFHIYRVRSGQYLGYDNSVNIKVQPEMAEVIALLPYRIKDLIVNSKNRIKKGEVLNYEIELLTDPLSTETHILNVNVISPGGKELSYYMQNLKAEKGKAKGSIHFALNEKEGKYLLRVKEVVSGIIKDYPFEIAQ